VKKWIVVLLALFSVLSLVGCGASPKPAGPVVEAQGVEETIPVVKNQAAGTVIAEGIVKPARSSQLSFKIPGDVVEVLVKTGDRVPAGAPLARLDARELTLALHSAEQDVLAQQAALQQLLDGASEKVIARADKGYRDQIAQAEVALQAKQLQLDKARAEDPSTNVAAAQARVKQLEYSLAQGRAQASGPSVTTAEVALERARIALDDTQDEYNKALDRPWEDQAIRDTWAKRLEQAQLDHKAAQAQMDQALNAQKAHQSGLNVLAAQVEEAKAQLAQAIVAQQTYSTTLDILAADVEAARLQVEALKTWDNPYRDEASDQEVAQAKAMLEKAKIAADRIRLQLEDTELAAPFAGVVVDVPAKTGDQANPGQVAVVLATLDKLEIHTKDLTELDVSHVTVGRPVRITVDAQPDQAFAGTVHDIALQSTDYRGDTVYEVTVTLDEQPGADALRWGMTTMVEIEGE
jgi:HlyD family secretion protein